MGKGGGIGLAEVARTVSPRCSFVIQVVAHDCHCFVQEIRDLGLALALESFLHEVDVVAPTGLDEDFAHGSALFSSVTIPTAQPKTLVHLTSCSSSVAMLGSVGSSKKSVGSRGESS